MAEIRDPENTLLIELKDGGGRRRDAARRGAAPCGADQGAGAGGGIRQRRLPPGDRRLHGADRRRRARRHGGGLQPAAGGDRAARASRTCRRSSRKLPFDRGVLGMARSQNPNSGNSQFFIMFDDGHFLNGQYTVWGRVTRGMEHVDAIQRGEPPASPDRMVSVRVAGDA